MYLEIVSRERAQNVCVYKNNFIILRTTNRRFWGDIYGDGLSLLIAHWETTLMSMLMSWKSLQGRSST